VLHGESPEEVAQSTHLGESDRRTLEALPQAAVALESLPFPKRFPIAASLPDFLAERFLAQLGAEAEAVAAALNERAPLTARVNTLKTDREGLLKRLHQEGIDARPTPLSPLGIFLDTRVNAFSLEAFKAGLFELQDEGSQLLGMLVDAPPTQVLDACAGAGGKTLQLAAQMKNRGELHALDIDERRLEELKRRGRRAGVHNTRIHVLGDAQGDPALEVWTGKMDRVLVDAPCSGTGTFRRKPDGRYRLTADDLSAHVARQKTLLERFAPLAKVRGRLIYGTCSLLREENEEVVAHFLGHHPHFALRPVAERLGEGLAEQVSENGFLRLYPHRHGTDGFFGALLERVR
jgi:16S rRNA (cytosine967-C5)-methyltransferase